jgi:hypothetical protein
MKSTTPEVLGGVLCRVLCGERARSYSDRRGGCVWVKISVVGRGLRLGLEVIKIRIPARGKERWMDMASRAFGPVCVCGSVVKRKQAKT